MAEIGTNAVEYTVRAHPYTFAATVMQQGSFVRIRFGGIGKKKCVHFGFDVDDENPNIDGLGYDRDCVVQTAVTRAHLEHTSGTLIMLKTAIWFLYHLYPNMGDVWFKDASHITCKANNIGGQPARVHLYQFYLVKHGKTWYQKKLGAMLIEPSATDDVKAFLRYIRDPRAKKDFDAFCAEYIPVGVFGPKRRGALLQMFRNVYSTHRTYHGFFKELADDYDCAVFDTWLNIFFVKHCRVPFENYLWRIPRGEVADDYANASIINSQNTRFMGGGGVYNGPWDPRNEFHVAIAYT